MKRNNNSNDVLIDSFASFLKDNLKNNAQNPMQQVIIANECRVLDNNVNFAKGFNALILEYNYQKAIYYFNKIK